MAQPSYETVKLMMDLQCNPDNDKTGLAKGYRDMLFDSQRDNLHEMLYYFTEFL